jgi:branched-chain amino acid aminotransferase
VKYINADGKIVTATENTLLHTNRSFRYGDGLFETMKMVNGKILLKDFHFERLFSSLGTLKYKIPAHFTASFLEKILTELAEKNECSRLCRIRLTLFRGHGNLYPTPAAFNYIAESSLTDPAVNNWNEKGLSIGLYREAQKSCDSLSNVKSANFLPYVMATIHAEAGGMGDCLLLNSKGNIADATIANIFLVRENTIYTPALSEGCVNGVMRKYLLQKLKENGYTCLETAITEEDILNADEIFLTNVMYGIRWVKNYNDKQFEFSWSYKFYNDFIKTIFTR